MIRIDRLTFTYPEQSLLFENFTLGVKRGETWAVIGPSGCGKTTLLYLLARLLKPVSGTIDIADKTLKRPRPGTGLVLQDHGLLPWATVYKNAVLGLTIRNYYGPDGRHTPVDFKLDKAEIDRRVNHWLERFGIASLKDKFPSRLSRGQRQRTALARTMAMAPDLLLLDEPFSALDAFTGRDLQKLILSLNQEENLTCLIVTHNIDEAVFMGSKILVLDQTTNREACIIENECAGFADHSYFQTRCEEVGSLLEKMI